MYYGEKAEAFEAVIFDLDGTLIDSEPDYSACDREVFASWGIELTVELNRSLMGLGNLDCLRVLDGLFPGCPFSRLPLEERAARRDAVYLARGASRAKAFPAMAGLVARLAETGMPLAIASGSSPAVIRASLEASGIAPYFPVIVAASEVALGKPAPDIFLEAASRLCAAPAGCLVFEDAAKGIEAAVRAGMRCVALPSMDADLAAFAGADLVLHGGPSAASAEELFHLVQTLSRSPVEA